MAAGSKSGGRTRRLRLGVSAFIRDEGGYTSVAVVIALLVSFSLVFAAASAEWVMGVRGVRRVAARRHPRPGRRLFD